MTVIKIDTLIDNEVNLCTFSDVNLWYVVVFDARSTKISLDFNFELEPVFFLNLVFIVIEDFVEFNCGSVRYFHID